MFPLGNTKSYNILGVNFLPATGDFQHIFFLRPRLTHTYLSSHLNLQPARPNPFPAWTLATLMK